MAFGDRFVEAVLNEGSRELNKGASGDDFNRVLRETYNSRQIQHARCHALVPAKGGPLKDTLYWEFSRILLRLLDDQNPATLTFINLLVAEMTKPRLMMR